MPEIPRIIGIIGGSHLVNSDAINSIMQPTVVQTSAGAVRVMTGSRQNIQVVYCQRHEADPDKEFTLPRMINYEAIALAMKMLKCDLVIGFYTVGSLKANIPVGATVLIDDRFSPFIISSSSNTLSAFILPDLTGYPRETILTKLTEGDFEVVNGGVYVQSLGPRFGTSAEVRFFAEYGHVVGMTGATEADFFNSLRIPFSMIATVGNMANGVTKIEIEMTRLLQLESCSLVEKMVLYLLDSFSQDVADVESQL